jgi:hypothetical protein
MKQYDASQKMTGMVMRNLRALRQKPEGKMQTEVAYQREIHQRVGAAIVVVVVVVVVVVKEEGENCNLNGSAVSLMAAMPLSA